MKRSELYALVWERPMIHVAKHFGISDVGLRKICVKHDIPTPPLGYWAKLAHGKKVLQPPLPPLKPDIQDQIYLTVRPLNDVPESVVQAQIEAREREALPKNQIRVPTERPEKLHQCATAVEKTLRKAKPDHEGFIRCSVRGIPSVKIGPGSLERTVLLIDTFMKALLARGYSFEDREDGLGIVVENETFAFSVYETKDKKAYEPKPDDIKRQAEYDERRKRYPEWYPAKTVWPTWDHFPSGRLCVEMWDPTQYRWNGGDVVGRWYDRGSKKVEDQFGSVMVALAAALALVKHRRAEAEKKARIEAEEAETRRKEKARREREKGRREFLLKRSDEYARFSTLAAFEGFIASKIVEGSVEPVDRIAHVLRDMVAEMSQQFERHALNVEIVRLGLFGDDDPI
jgi:hypothetical protein